MKAIYIVCMIALISAMIITPAAATTWYVHEGESIQAAIESASEGDTIFVYNGTYSSDEYIYLHKPNIKLIGEGADIVIFSPTSGDKKIYVGNPGDPTQEAPGCIIKGFKFLNLVGAEVRSDSPDCIIENCVFEGLTGSTVSLYFTANNTTFKNNVIEGGLMGPVFENAYGITCMDNIISNTTKTTYAMRLRHCLDSIVVNNTLINNAGGLGLYTSTAGPTTNTTVTRNNFISSGAGIKLYNAPSGNRIYLNNIVDCTQSVVISGTGTPTNIWNSTEPMEYVCPTDGNTYTNYLGNYWSDHPGGAEDGCGIWATPYDIPGSTTDHDFRPLMQPFENYPAPGPAQPDLTPTEINPNCGGYLFDGNNNEICALIENIGGAASAFSVSFDINGDIQKVAVTGLAAGGNTTVCVTDSIRTVGDTVAITVTADCDSEVTEDNETNNILSSSETVVYNGYKGKRYTGGEDITTKNTFDLNGDLVYSAGDSYYLGCSAKYGGDPDWTAYDASWTDSDLVIPTTATVVDARLYIPYTWDKAGVMSGKVSLTFNAAAQTPDAHYWDEKMYGTSYPYGMLVYDVTGDFSAAGNIANLTNSHPGGNNVSMRGMMLVVVYEDANEARRQIFVNEEFDLLYGGSNYGTTPAEATAWAPITGAAINPALTANARLITFAPGADASAGEGELIFNTQTWNDEWTDNGVHQIGISDRDVTAYLLSTGNEVGFQSNADWMEASNAILIVEAVPSVKTATYSGTATFESSAGTIVDLTAIAESEMPDGGPDLMFPHGFFSFEITGLTPGDTVDVTVTLPASVPVGSQYWKHDGSAWVQIPIGDDDGDNVITITLTDGGLGDSDGLADGTIVDPSGPGVTNLIYLDLDNSVSHGSPVQVDVYTYISATDQAIASQFDIEYDPNCIQDFPSFDNTGSDWLVGAGAAVTCTNPASGILRFTTNVGQNPAISGHAKVGTLTFTCNTTCCGTFLNFTGAKYTDASIPAKTITPAVDSGTFLCNDPNAPIMEVTKQVWEDGTGWVDALGPLGSEWVGQDVIFKITATAGCLDLSDIVVEDVMDSSLLYNYNANPTEDTSTAHTADWSFSTILAGNSESIEFNATIDGIGINTNTATVTATVTNLGVEVQADDTATVETMPPKPDLIVSDITVNYDLCSYGIDKAFGPTNHPGYLTQENKISANITELSGLEVTDPFDVTFEIDGTPVCTVQLPGIAAGATETVYCDDQFRPIAGVTYTITVTADSLTPSGEIPEDNETNNAMAKDITAMTLGYKGNHYQDGRSLTTTDSLEGQINLVYSPGDSYYLSSYSNPDWTTYEASWTPSDLPMPATDTGIKEAKLYVYYNWDKSPGRNITDYFSMDFNGNNILVNNHYSDIKWAGHYPYGMLVYDVANVFDVTGNTATLTNSYPGGDKVSMDGMLLVVVYNHSSEPNRIIRITEGYDMLGASTTGATYNYGVSSEEATAYASFTGSIPLDEVLSANLITVAAGASDGGDKNRLYFNGEMWKGIWNSYSGATQLGMNETDVLTCLSATDNIAGFQSHIPDGGTDGDGFRASNAFLVIQEKGIEMSAVPDSEDCYNVGEQFDVLININQFGAPIMGAQFDLHFNPNAFQAETVTYGDFLVGEGSVFIGNSEIDNLNGIVSFAAARQGTDIGVTEPGTFAIVHFTAMMQGETSDLDLVNVLASDNSTPVETIDVATINGTASVCLNPAPTAVAKSNFTYNNIAEKGLSKAYFNGMDSTDTAPGSITYWRWWIDDGTSVVGETAEHLFEVPMYWVNGSYVPANVTLTVTDDGIPLMDGSDSMDVIVWIAGDATGDGRVNIADAVTFGMQFGATCNIDANGLHWYDNLEGDKADLNNDKRVNIGDAMLLGTCWGHTAW